MSFTSYGLITTHALHRSYLQAADPKLRESSTVPFWENLLHRVMCTGEDNLVVNSQQPVDDTTKSVDVVVQYFDREFKPIILLMMECKRHSKAQRGIENMEQQLFSYAQYITLKSEGDVLRGKIVYGAVAYGTKIRAWRIINETESRRVTLEPIWGSSVIGDTASYRDPGKPSEAMEIANLLFEAKGAKHTVFGNQLLRQQAGGPSPEKASSSSNQPSQIFQQYMEEPSHGALSPANHQAQGASQTLYWSQECVYAQILSYHGRNQDKVRCMIENVQKDLECSLWQAATIEYEGMNYQGFVYHGRSGTVYYT